MTCMRAHVHACTRECEYACMSAWARAQEDGCSCVCVLRTFVDAHMRPCVQAIVNVRMRTCVHACIRVCMHACVHVSVHACLHACVHARMRACMHAHMARIKADERISRSRTRRRARPKERGRKYEWIPCTHSSLAPNGALTDAMN